MVTVYTEVLDFTVPNSLPAGADVNVRVQLRNADSIEGYVHCVINGNPNSPDDYITVEGATSHPTSTLPGDSIWLDVYFRYFKMPNWDFNLIATNEGGSSQISRTIHLSTGEGKAEITEISLPSELSEGVWITGYIIVTNIGGATADLKCIVTTEWDSKEYEATGTIHSGGILKPTISSGLIQMPNQDAVMTIRAYHYKDGEWILDDTKTH